MEKSSFTLDRQKLLIGAAALGLVAAVSIALQPDVKLVRQASAPAVEVEPDDDSLEIEFAEEPEATPARELAGDAPEALAPSTDAAPADVKPYVRNRKKLVRTAAVMPPPYAHRLTLLHEEQELLLKRTSIAPQLSPTTVDPPMAGPNVTLTLVEGTDAQPVEVIQAVAEAANPAELRRVNLVQHHPLQPVVRPETTNRGAWLSGVIEME